MRIQSITIYPIKSLGPVHLQEAWVEPAGLRGDRRYMLVDAQHQFITQRTRPELTRFTIEQQEGGFLIKDKLSQSHKFLAHEVPLGSLLKVKIWDDEGAKLTSNFDSEIYEVLGSGEQLIEQSEFIVITRTIKSGSNFFTNLVTSKKPYLDLWRQY